MDNFELNLLTEWRKLELPVSGATFVAGVSGGADSLSLILALSSLKLQRKLDLRFVIAHFNHELRGAESRRDEEFVRAFAAAHRFELAVGRGDIPKDGNIEQNARRERYRFLAETAKRLHARGVLTAHTINDQAETFLMNLIRGSGTRGLSGMAPIREFGKIRAFDVLSEVDERDTAPDLILIRPLLRWARRKDTEVYCHGRQAEFRYDSMNDDLAFQRVRVRKVLMPMLKEFNPKIVETLARTADLLRTELESEQSPTSDAGPEPDWTAETIPLAALNGLPKARIYHGLRRWLESRRGDLRGVELKHIEAIERLIVSRKSGRCVEIPNKGRVLKSGGKIIFEK